VAKYDPSAIEPKWQQTWEQEQLFKAKRVPGKPKRYVLSMFPYPSGKLHMGHVMNYTISDVIVRYSLMKGYSVLSPIGWDSFGLPAENAAIREGIHPSENIRLNIDHMKGQMRRAGWGFDWEREVSTSEESYYRWTQWLFLQFYKAGLVEKRKAPVNWCPNDMTVLANEQVHEGRCERCGTPVEQRDLEQWFYLMSKYAEKLLAGHEKLTKWPERVIKMQKEWIGKSEGARIEFTLEGTSTKIPIFTTRPDTLWGVTFMSMAAQHPLIDELIKDQPNREEIMTAVRKMRQQGTSEIDILTREKEGVFTGRYVINPVNGDRVPLWIANFVLMTYGTGCVMAVPAHDQRDFEFARKHGIPIKTVIQPKEGHLDPQTMTAAYVDDGTLENSAQFTDRNNREAMPAIIAWLKEQGKGEGMTTYRLRDWLLSRQRYWGAPIPIVYCEKCGTVPVPEADLPVRLPRNVEFKPTGESPLKRCPDFMNTSCPKCGGKAQRDADTMDTFVDSSWYYLRYASPNSTNAPFDREQINQWCPVDIYIGGIEHATMHLIYFRFFNLVLKELGLIDFDEPADLLFCQGMVCKTAYYCETDKWLPEDKVKDGRCLICGLPARSEMTKMSKTKLNVVSPEEIIERYGADTMRMYILSDNPPDRDQMWNETGVQGVSRFLNRLWETYDEILPKIKTAGKAGDAAVDKELRRSAHTALQKGIQAVENNWQFNTAIARIIELLATVRKSAESASPAVVQECCEILIKLLAPITPHIAEELWQRLGHTESIFLSPLPAVDESALKSDEVTIVVQVNGKLRGNFTAAAGASNDELEKEALANEKIRQHLEGKTVRKVIVVPGKLVNIVAG
jgi:leucyl-tRNA synthetase